MKIPLLQQESTVKHSLAFKESTDRMLRQYQQLYFDNYQVEISMRDMVELMLLNFLSEDKIFQKALKSKDSPLKPASSVSGMPEPSVSAPSASF